jgi:hypothetical protein
MWKPIAAGRASPVQIAMLLILVLVLLGGIAAVLGAGLPPPPDWLTGWTTWLLTAISAVFAPVVLKSAADALSRRAKDGV